MGDPEAACSAIGAVRARRWRGEREQKQGQGVLLLASLVARQAHSEGEAWCGREARARVATQERRRSGSGVPVVPSKAHQPEPGGGHAGPAQPSAPLPRRRRSRPAAALGW
uniref:Uncharacterized protein n=1 Tax=Arundo donax TaxID=35708 RepID=A0A0A8ZT54_ARUDO